MPAEGGGISGELNGVYAVVREARGEVGRPNPRHLGERVVGEADEGTEVAAGAEEGDEGGGERRRRDRPRAAAGRGECVGMQLAHQAGGRGGGGGVDWRQRGGGGDEVARGKQLGLRRRRLRSEPIVEHECLRVFTPHARDAAGAAVVAELEPPKPQTTWQCSALASGGASVVSLGSAFRFEMNQSGRREEQRGPRRTRREGEDEERSALRAPRRPRGASDGSKPPYGAPVYQACMRRRAAAVDSRAHRV